MTNSKNIVTNDKILNLPIPPREAWKLGLRTFWSTRPASIVTSPWFDPFGCNAMCVSAIQPTDILTVIRRQKAGTLALSRIVNINEIKLDGNDYSIITDELYETSEITLANGKDFHDKLLTLIKSLHGTVYGYVMNKIVHTGPCVAVVKYQQKYRCNVANPQPIYKCHGCGIHSSIMGSQPSPKVSADYYDNISITNPEHAEEILAKRGTDINFMLPNSVIGQMSDLRSLAIGGYGTEQQDDFFEEYACEFCGDSLKYKPRTLLRVSAPTLEKVPDIHIGYGMNTLLDQLKVESLLDGFDDLNGVTKHELMAMDGKIVGKFLRELSMSAISIPANLSRQDTLAIAEVLPGLNTGSILPQGPSNPLLYTELAALTSLALNKTNVMENLIVGSTTQPIINGRVLYQDHDEWLIKCKTPQSLSFKQPTTIIAEQLVELDSLISLVQRQHVVHVILVEPSVCYSIEDETSYQLFPPNVRDPLIVPKSTYDFLNCDFMDVNGTSLMVTIINQLPHCKLVSVTAVTQRPKYKLENDEWFETELPMPDYFSVFGKWPLLNIYQAKVKLYPKLMSALCIRNINGTLTKPVLMQIAELYVKQMYNIRGKLISNSDMGPEAIELHVNMCICYMKSQNQLYKATQEMSTWMQWAGVLSQFVPIQELNIKTFISMFFSSNYEKMGDINDIITKVKRLVTSIDIRNYTKIWKKINSYQTYYNQGPLIEYKVDTKLTFKVIEKQCEHHGPFCNHADADGPNSCTCCGIKTSNKKLCNCCAPVCSSEANYSSWRTGKYKNKQRSEQSKVQNKETQSQIVTPSTKEALFTVEEISEAITSVVASGTSELPKSNIMTQIQSAKEYSSNNYSIVLPGLAKGYYTLPNQEYKLLNPQDVSSVGKDCAFNTLDVVCSVQVNIAQMRALLQNLDLITDTEISKVAQFLKLNVIVITSVAVSVMRNNDSDEYGIMCHSNAVPVIDENHYYATDLVLTAPLQCLQLDINDYSITDAIEAMDAIDKPYEEYLSDSVSMREATERTISSLLRTLGDIKTDFLYSSTDNILTTISYPLNNKKLDLDAGLLYFQPSIELANLVGKLQHVSTQQVKSESRIEPELLPLDLQQYAKSLVRNLCHSVYLTYHSPVLASELANVNNFEPTSCQLSGKEGYWINYTSTTIKTFDVIYIKHFSKKKKITTTAVVRRRMKNKLLITCEANLPFDISIATSKQSTGSIVRAIIGYSSMSLNRNALVSWIKANKKHYFGAAGVGKTHTLKNICKKNDVIIMRTYNARNDLQKALRILKKRPTIMSSERFMWTNVTIREDSILYIDEAKMMDFTILLRAMALGFKKFVTLGDVYQIGNVEMTHDTLISAESNLIKLIEQHHKIEYNIDTRRFGGEAVKELATIINISNSFGNETKYNFENCNGLEDVIVLHKIYKPDKVLCMYKDTKRILIKLLTTHSDIVDIEELNNHVSTTHSTQGSEFESVMVVLHNNGNWGLNGDRDYITSATTRMKQHLIVVVVGHPNIKKLSDCVSSSYRGLSVSHSLNIGPIALLFRARVNELKKKHLNLRWVPSSDDYRLTRELFDDKFNARMNNCLKIEDLHECLNSLTFSSSDIDSCKFKHNSRLYTVINLPHRAFKIVSISDKVGVYEITVSAKIIKILTNPSKDWNMKSVGQLSKIIRTPETTELMEKGNFDVSWDHYQRLRVIAWAMDMYHGSTLTFNTAHGPITAIKYFGCSLQSDMMFYIDQDNYILIEKAFTFHFGKKGTLVGDKLVFFFNWLQYGLMYKGAPDFEINVKFAVDLWAERVDSILHGNGVCWSNERRINASQANVNSTGTIMNDYNQKSVLKRWRGQLMFHGHGSLFIMDDPKQLICVGQQSKIMQLNDVNVLDQICSIALVDIDENLWLASSYRSEYKGLTDRVYNLNIPLEDHKAEATPVWGAIVTHVSQRKLQRATNTSQALWLPIIPEHVLLDVRSSYPLLTILSVGTCKMESWFVKTLERISCLQVGQQNSSDVYFCGYHLDSPTIQNQHYTKYVQASDKENRYLHNNLTELDAVASINSFRQATDNLKSIKSLSELSDPYSVIDNSVVNLGLYAISISIHTLKKLVSHNEVYGLLPCASGNYHEFFLNYLHVESEQYPIPIDDDMKELSFVGKPIMLSSTEYLATKSYGYCLGFHLVKFVIHVTPQPVMLWNSKHSSDLVQLKLPWINNNIPDLLSGANLLEVRDVYVSKKLYKRVLAKAVGSDKSKSELLMHIRSIATTEITNELYQGQKYPITADTALATATAVSVAKTAFLNKLWMLNQGVDKLQTSDNSLFKSMAQNMFNMTMNMAGVTAEIKNQLLQNPIMDKLIDNVRSMPIIAMMETFEMFKLQIESNVPNLLIWSGKQPEPIKNNMALNKKLSETAPISTQVDFNYFDIAVSIGETVKRMQSEKLMLRDLVSKTKINMDEFDLNDTRVSESGVTQKYPFRKNFKDKIMNSIDELNDLVMDEDQYGIVAEDVSIDSVLSDDTFLTAREGEVNDFKESRSKSNSLTNKILYVPAEKGKSIAEPSSPVEAQQEVTIINYGKIDAKLKSLGVSKFSKPINYTIKSTKVLLPSDDEHVDRWLMQNHNITEILPLELNWEVTSSTLYNLVPTPSGAKHLMGELQIQLLQLLKCVPEHLVGSIHIITHNYLVEWAPIEAFGACTLYRHIPLIDRCNTGLLPSIAKDYLMQGAVRLVSEKTQSYYNLPTVFPTIIQLSDKRNINLGGYCVKNLLSVSVDLSISSTKPFEYYTTKQPFARVKSLPKVVPSNSIVHMPFNYTSQSIDDHLTIITMGDQNQIEYLKKLKRGDEVSELWTLKYNHVHNISPITDKSFLQIVSLKHSCSHTKSNGVRITHNPITEDFCVKACLIHHNLDEDWIVGLPAAMSQFEVVNTLLKYKVNFTVIYTDRLRNALMSSYTCNLFKDRPYVSLMLMDQPSPHCVCVSIISIDYCDQIDWPLQSVDETLLSELSSSDLINNYKSLEQELTNEEKVKELTSILALNGFDHRMKQSRIIWVESRTVSKFSLIYGYLGRALNKLCLCRTLDNTWVPAVVMPLTGDRLSVGVVSVTGLSGPVIILNHNIDRKFIKTHTTILKTTSTAYSLSVDTMNLLLSKGTTTQLFNSKNTRATGQLYIQTYDNRSHHGRTNMTSVLASGKFQLFGVGKKGKIKSLILTDEFYSSFNNALNRQMIIDGWLCYSVEFVSVSLAKLFNTKYKTSREGALLYSTSKKFENWLELSEHTTSVKVNLFKPKQSTLKDDLTLISNQERKLLISANNWLQIPSRTWPQFVWSNLSLLELDNEGCLLFSENNSDWLLTKTVNLYKKLSIKGGHKDKSELKILNNQHLLTPAQFPSIQRNLAIEQSSQTLNNDSVSVHPSTLTISNSHNNCNKSMDNGDLVDYGEQLKPMFKSFELLDRLNSLKLKAGSLRAKCFASHPVLYSVKDGKLSQKIHFSSQSLAMLFNVKYNLVCTNNALFSNTIIMKNWLQLSCLNVPLEPQFLTPRFTKFQDDLNDVHQEELKLEIRRSDWTIVLPSAWPKLPWTAIMVDQFEDNRCWLCSFDGFDWLLTSSVNLYKKNVIKGGVKATDGEIEYFENKSTHPSNWWNLMPKIINTKLDPDTKPIDISFMEDVDYGYNNSSSILPADTLPDVSQDALVCTTTSTLPLIMDTRDVVDDGDLDNYDFWNNTDMTTLLARAAPNKNNRTFATREVPYKESKLKKHTSVPMPAKSRPVDTKSAYKDHNTIVTRLLNITKLRQSGSKADPRVMVRKLKKAYGRPDVDQYFRWCNNNKVVFDSEKTHAWINKHHNAKKVFAELAQFVDMGVLFKQLSDVNFHLKLESLLKTDVIGDFFAQSPRPIVYQNYFVAAIFSPIFMEMKSRVKAMLSDKYTYVDGLTPLQINRKLAKYDEVKWFFYNDLKKQDKQTDDPLIQVEMELYKQLGASDAVMSIWPVVHDAWLFKSKYSKGLQKSMRTTGQATTALGNFITNLQVHADFVLKNQLRIVFGLFLGDDNVLGLNQRIDMSRLKKTLAYEHNMMAKPFLSENSAEFCCFILYKRDATKVGIGPDYVRLKNRYEVTNGERDLTEEISSARKLSYLTMLGPTPEVKALIAKESLPIIPVMWYDQQEAILAMADHNVCSIDSIISHYSHLLMAIEDQNIYTYTWLINTSKKY